MSLFLNEIEIKGSDLKLAATLPLAGEDISGQSSLDVIAEKGDKSKQLSVSLLIRFLDAENLSKLVDLAENKDDKGARITYDIVNNTADAMNIRQVRFLGDLSVREDESLELWRVSFKLSEMKSVAEAKESRQTTQSTTDQPPTGEVVQPVDSATPDAEELSSFENVMKWVDDQIGKISS